MAVTGTSGKSSVADFTRQLFALLGHKAASLGTLGVITSDGTAYGSLTTPDPVSLHATLDRLAREGVTHLAMEASSHGIDQRRLDAVRLRAGGVTNLGRDHLDYHGNTESYAAAKLRLFDTLLPADAPAIVNADGPYADVFRDGIRRRGLTLLTTGSHGDMLKLLEARPEGFGQRLKVEAFGRVYETSLPLLGAFQVENALLAAGLVLAVEGEAYAKNVLEGLSGLHGVSGRLESVGEVNGALCIVDYAHKPDALSHVLDALRPFTTRRLVCVFGCGGDRDRGKRPLMGRIAADKADVVIVTDDNPRSEDPGSHPRRNHGSRARCNRDCRSRPCHQHGYPRPQGRRRSGGCRKGPRNGPDHRRPDLAVFGSRRGSCGDCGEPRMSATLWTRAEIEIATGGQVGASFETASGASIDTRTLASGDLYFAIKGDVHDGHDFVEAALSKGAAAAVVSREKSFLFERSDRLIVVTDVLEAMRRPGNRRPCAQQSRDRCDHGLGGKDRHQGGDAFGAGATGPDARIGRILQQSLGSAADTRAHAAGHRNTGFSRSA